MKEKRVNKSEEQLVAEMEQKKNVERQRVIARDCLFPLLVNNSKSVDDAKLFAQAFSVAIKQAFNNKMRDIKVGDLKLETMLDTSSPDIEKWKLIIEMFKNETLLSALTIVEGMSGAIDSFIREEMTLRKLDTLKTSFL